MNVETIKKVLKGLGLKVSESSVIQGASGIDHEFLLVGESESGGKTAFELLDGAKPEISVLASFAKVLDTAAKCVLLSSGEVTEDTRTLARAYNMLIVDPNDIGRNDVKRYLMESSGLMISPTLGKVFARVLEGAKPLIDPTTKIVLGGSLLSLHEVEALQISGMEPCRMILGYTVLKRFAEADTSKYYSLLWEPCESVARGVPHVSDSDTVSQLLTEFGRTGFGQACLESHNTHHLLTLYDVVEALESMTLSTELTVREVASPVLRLSENHTVADALREMFRLKIRRIFITDTSFVSDRHLIKFLFSPAILVEMRDSPHEVTKHTLSELRHSAAEYTSSETRLSEALHHIRPKSGECLVCDEGVVTPWDLVMKPWKLGKLTMGQYQISQ